MRQALIISLTLCLALQCSSGFPINTSSSRGGMRLHSYAQLSSVLDESPVKTPATRDLPPLLQDMVEERREFELNLGKAMDVLRNDYPHMLYKTPDYSIYHSDISVVDPSGVRLSGLGSYKQSFRFLQTLVGVFYDMEQSNIRQRMVYDFARSSIRMSWNVVLVPRVVGNRRNSLYVDGTSVYKMDSSSGKIVEHKVENLLINNIPVTPPYGILKALHGELLQPAELGVPVGVGALTASR